jgi:lipoyl-dependent peroxiredoxin
MPRRTANARWEGITRIDVVTHARVGEVGLGEFQHIAFEAERNCPVSKALAGVERVRLDARLLPQEA